MADNTKTKENPESINETISRHTGLSEDFVEVLIKEGLDFEDLGEYVAGADEEGVYVMDVSNACGDYTLEPIPHKEFLHMLITRVSEKLTNYSGM